jgi:nucleoside-diphosphate-sugar epimerase
MRVFVAGASGVIGRPLVEMLVQAGHEVTASTRTAAKATDLKALGATPVVVDVHDAEALKQAVGAQRPEVVIHQLTDLPDVVDPAKMPAALEANARLRIDGTYNLTVAAKLANARRMIAQSISFMYAPGRQPYRETDPLIGPEASISSRGVHALEGAVLGTPGIEGIVLRYGHLYGPGTWADRPTGTGFVHTEAAAHAALLALTHGSPGIYNIAEDDGEVVIDKARRELGFDPGYRLRRA